MWWSAAACWGLFSPPPLSLLCGCCCRLTLHGMWRGRPALPHMQPPQGPASSQITGSWFVSCLFDKIVVSYFCLLIFSFFKYLLHGKIFFLFIYLLEFEVLSPFKPCSSYYPDQLCRNTVRWPWETFFFSSAIVFPSILIAPLPSYIDIILDLALLIHSKRYVGHHQQENGVHSSKTCFFSIFAVSPHKQYLDWVTDCD